MRPKLMASRRRAQTGRRRVRASGLGYQHTQAQGLLDTDRVSIAILTGVVAGVILFLDDRLERSLLKWRPQPG